MEYESSLKHSQRPTLKASLFYAWGQLVDREFESTHLPLLNGYLFLPQKCEKSHLSLDFNGNPCLCSLRLRWTRRFLMISFPSLETSFANKPWLPWCCFHFAPSEAIKFQRITGKAQISRWRRLWFNVFHQFCRETKRSMFLIININWKLHVRFVSNFVLSCKLE